MHDWIFDNRKTSLGEDPNKGSGRWPAKAIGMEAASLGAAPKRSGKTPERVAGSKPATVLDAEAEQIEMYIRRTAPKTLRGGHRQGIGWSQHLGQVVPKTATVFPRTKERQTPLGFLCRSWAVPFFLLHNR